MIESEYFAIQPWFVSRMGYTVKNKVRVIMLPTHIVKFVAHKISEGVGRFSVSR